MAVLKRNRSLDCFPIVEARGSRTTMKVRNRVRLWGVKTSECCGASRNWIRSYRSEDETWKPMMSLGDLLSVSGKVIIAGDS